MDLAEIGGELRLQELAGRDVLVRFDDFAPRQQAADRVDGNIRQPPGLAALLVALKLGELGAKDRVAHLAEPFGGRAGADGLHQAAHGVQRTLGVVIGKRLVVRELVSDVGQFVHDRALRSSEHVLERVHPETVHGVEERRLIPRDVAVAARLQSKLFGNPNLPVAGQGAFQSLRHKRRQRLRQHFHAVEYVLAGALGHALRLLRHAVGVAHPLSFANERGHRLPRRPSKYSTSADRPTISTIRTPRPVPSASVSRSSSPGMNWTGCCLPSSIAIFDAYR